MRPPSQISKVKNLAISVLSKIVPFHPFLFKVKISNSGSAIAQNEFERSARSWYRSASKTSMRAKKQQTKLNVDCCISIHLFVTLFLESFHPMTQRDLTQKRLFRHQEIYIYFFLIYTFLFFLFYLSCLSVHPEDLTTEMHILTVEILKFLVIEPHWCRILSDL